MFRYLRTTFSLIKNTSFFSQDLRFVKSMATGVQSKWEVIHNMKLTGVDHNHCKYKYTTQWKNSTILKKFCYYHIHKKETLKMMFKKIYIIISCTYTVIKLKKKIKYKARTWTTFHKRTHTKLYHKVNIFSL